MSDPQRAWERLLDWARQAPPEPEPEPGLPAGFVPRVLAMRRRIGPPDERAVFESLAMRAAIAAILLMGLALLWGLPAEPDATPFDLATLMEGAP